MSISFSKASHCRYKLVAGGGRQIMAYLVPGDFCDLHVFILKAMDHSIGTLSQCSVVSIDRARIVELTERPAIARALWWATLVDEATVREWVVNVGARPADERLAHLLCELLVRLKAVGLADGGSYELPITQVDLADTVGLSTVHVNRVLQRLRALELITLRNGRLVILDVEKLNAFSGFNPNYLHLSRQTASKKDDA
jgi:CRP-like cAMP-binding protein